MDFHHSVALLTVISMIKIRCGKPIVIGYSRPFRSTIAANPHELSLARERSNLSNLVGRLVQLSPD